MKKWMNPSRWFVRIASTSVNRAYVKWIAGLLIAVGVAEAISHFLFGVAQHWVLLATVLSWYGFWPLLLLRQYRALALVFSAVLAVMSWMTIVATSLVGVAVSVGVVGGVAIYVGCRFILLAPVAWVMVLLALLVLRDPIVVAMLPERLCEVSVGMVITILAQISVARSRLLTDVRIVLANSLLRLMRLSQAIFAGYVTHDYAEKHFLQGRKLHYRRSDYFYLIQQARLLLQAVPVLQQENYNALLHEIERVYEILQAISLLIRRVQDHSTFAVADKEFLAFTEKLEQRFHQLANHLYRRRHVAVSDELNECIFEFDEINRSMLQVVAAEPLVFIIFIHDLRALDQRLQAVTTIINALAVREKA